MSRVFYKREIAAKATPSDEDVRAYYEAHRERIRAELHVLQILIKRDRAKAERLLAEIREGVPFDEVASRLFPARPAQGRPAWDLGYLNWQQIPETWGDVVYQLKPGQVSDLIAGPGERYWIVKLVDRREQDMPLEAALPMIRDKLSGTAVTERRAAIERELRANAQVEVSKAAPPTDD